MSKNKQKPNRDIIILDFIDPIGLDFICNEPTPIGQCSYQEVDVAWYYPDGAPYENRGKHIHTGRDIFIFHNN